MRSRIAGAKAASPQTLFCFPGYSRMRHQKLYKPSFKDSAKSKQKPALVYCMVGSKRNARNKWNGAESQRRAESYQAKCGEQRRSTPNQMRRVVRKWLNQTRTARLNQMRTLLLRLHLLLQVKNKSKNTLALNASRMTGSIQKTRSTRRSKKRLRLIGNSRTVICLCPGDRWKAHSSGCGSAMRRTSRWSSFRECSEPAPSRK